MKALLTAKPRTSAPDTPNVCTFHHEGAHVLLETSTPSRSRAFPCPSSSPSSRPPMSVPASEKVGRLRPTSMCPGRRDEEKTDPMNYFLKIILKTCGELRLFEYICPRKG
ncbi:MAG: hypothetical protein J6W75_12930 [Bacteroidaceae bacterium]|nr:hypothetical protein [Bacteroidaceae bacterium]